MGFLNVAVFNQPGTYSFICPGNWDVNNFKIECLGGGQCGLTSVANWVIGGAGGASGCYGFFDPSLVFQNNAPKPGDTLIITVADVMQPQLASDNLIVGGWKRGNPSTVFFPRLNQYTVYSFGGQTNPLPPLPNVPLPVASFGSTSFAGGALAETFDLPGDENFGLSGGDGCGGGASNAGNFGVDGGGGTGDTNAALPGVPGAGYGLPGSGGASFYPPPNEPVSIRDGGNFRTGTTISQGTNGGYFGFNSSDPTDISNFNVGFDGQENPILNWTDTFNGAKMGLGGGGGGGRGWWRMTDPELNVPAPASNFPHNKIFLLANLSGAIQPFSSYYGYKGGNGGRAAGGGGGGVGYTVNQGETGIGGLGGMGGVVISWGSTNPAQNLSPNLIPLPYPHYAMTPRGLFYPWGLKR